MKTTREKIGVMEAFEQGEEIEIRSLTLKFDCAQWSRCPDPGWNWVEADYRIKPKPREVWVYEADGKLFGHWYAASDKCERAESRYHTTDGRAVRFVEAD